MRTNYHTHLKRCGHAEGAAEDYVKEAVRKGLSELGFSDHGPFPDKDYGFRMPFAELAEYLEEVGRQREKYRKDIAVRTGLEIEYLPEYGGYYEELLNGYGVDYLLLGQHFYRRGRGEVFASDARSTEEYVEYARSVAEGMRLGVFRSVAHPDTFLGCPFAWDDNCMRAADIIIETALVTDTILEFNANGYRRGLCGFPDGVRYPYPNRCFWEMAASAGVKTVVGSDCHAPGQLWDEMLPKAYAALEELGITPLEGIGI